MALKTFKFFAAFLLFAGFVSSARAAQYGDIVVEVISSPNGERTHGYGETRVSVTNRSPKDRHHVVLTLPLQSYAGGTAKRTIIVEPSSTITISLFTPYGFSGTGLGVEIDGQLQRDVVALNLTGYTYGYSNRSSILLSKAASAIGFETRSSKFLNPDDDESVHITSSPAYTAGGPTVPPPSAKDLRFSMEKSETPTSEWSTSWLGYSAFDGVVLTADEMRLLPEPITSALTRYVECGGSLLVIGAWQPPQTWKIEKKQDGALSTYSVGFGTCMVSESAAIEGLKPEQWDTIAKEWEQTRTPWTTLGSLSTDIATANRDFPVVENVNIPVRGLLLMMLLFVILIGPVNLLVLSRKKRRMWLLWTVPLISVVTCGAVSAYTVLSEGWGGRARYLSYTILDERSHRATSIGLEAFYSPLTPGDGLRYGTETEIAAQATGIPYRYDGRHDSVVDWTEDQHLETGWVTARTPAHFMMRRTETRRERLLVNRGSDGELMVVNGLGVSIKNLWLADDVGFIYQASNVPAGASVKLQETGQRISTGKANVMRKVFAGDWMPAVQQPASAGDLVRPRTYIADIENCIFLEEGLKSVKNKKHEARVYGIMKAPGDED